MEYKIDSSPSIHLTGEMLWIRAADVFPDSFQSVCNTDLIFLTSKRDRG